MYRWWCFFLLLSLVSCDFFLSKEERKDRLVNQKLRAIDWNNVDKYPLFENCDEMATKAIQRECFLQTMATYLNQAFEGLYYEVEQEVNDTIDVDLSIDEHGFITLVNIQGGDVAEQQLPNLSNELSERLNDLTTVAPALKQGVPVSVRLRLPLILNTED